MSASLHLATPDDLGTLMPMVATCHAETGVTLSDEARAAGLTPLLEGSPHGAVWLIGPRKSPVGYIAVTFGWSIWLGGLDGTIAEFFIRESVRGRGMGTEVLIALTKELGEGGLRALHAEVPPGNDRAQRMAKRLGFRAREGHRLMTWRARSDV